jgi:hypothetical protein
MTEKKITCISNGIESTYVNYNENNFKAKEDLILLIKIAKTEGEKIIFLRSEERFNWLIDEFKIELNNYKIIPISWIDDFNGEIYKIKNSSVFIFSFESYGEMPEFLSNPNRESNFGFPIDSSTKSVLDEYERQNLKKIFTSSSIENNVNYYFSEPIISVVKKQRIEKFDYTNTTISDGEIKKVSSNAAHIKWNYRFEGYKLNKIFETAISTKKSCLFYYPHKSKNEDESHEEAGIIEILYPNKEDYFKYISRFIWVYLGYKNIAIAKVPSIKKDKMGNFIFPNIFNKINHQEETPGFVKYVPTEEELIEINSINALHHFVLYGETGFFTDSDITVEIQNILNNIIGNLFKFIPTKTIYTLKLLIEENKTNESIYFLNSEYFLKINDHYDNDAFKKLKEIQNWAIYYKRNLQYIL